MSGRRPRRSAEFFDPPMSRCPLCFAYAICPLPPNLLAAQPDATTHVCHPSWGGCNHGFELAPDPHKEQT